MKKNFFYVVLIIIFLTLIIFFYFHYKDNSIKETYHLQGNTFSYSKNRGNVIYDILYVNKTEFFDVYKIKFLSKSIDNNPLEIFSLLYVPKNKKELNAVIFLPGAGGTKESREHISTTLVKMGYAVLILDQRGIGETKSSMLGFQEDAKLFYGKKEPLQHLMVYDVLRSFDLLKQLDFVKINDVACMGASMGARYGLIATALENRIKGFVGISTSGFHVPVNPLIQNNDYLVSIDPDHYVSKISPRFFIMIHTKADNVIPLQDAELTFQKAKKPKKFYLIDNNNCIHGYCDEMYDKVKKSLLTIFNS